MEVATAEAAPAKGVGSRTIADLLPLAVRKHGSRRAILYKDTSGKWVPKTFAEVGDIGTAGLIDAQGIVQQQPHHGRGAQRLGAGVGIGDGN